MARILTILVVPIFIILLLVFGIISASTTHQRTITIDSKERQCDSNSDNKTECYYVVFSKEGEIYSNTDSLFRMKYNSGNIQAKLQVGKTYKVKTSGFRIPFLSSKENIISILEEVDNKDDSHARE